MPPVYRLHSETSLLCRVLLLPAVELAGAFKRDLILRDFAAFAHGWSLSARIGLGFRGRVRGLVDVDRVRTVDWSDHGGLLKDRIGRGRGNFRELRRDW